MNTRESLLNTFDFKLTQQPDLLKLFQAALIPTNRKIMSELFSNFASVSDCHSIKPYTLTFEKLINSTDNTLERIAAYQKTIIQSAVMTLLDDKGQIAVDIKKKFHWEKDLTQLQILDLLCSYIQAFNRQISDDIQPLILQNNKQVSRMCDLINANYGGWIIAMLEDKNQLFDRNALKKFDIKSSDKDKVEPLWLIKVIDIPPLPEPSLTSKVVTNSYNVVYTLIGAPLNIVSSTYNSLPALSKLPEIPEKATQAVINYGSNSVAWDNLKLWKKGSAPDLEMRDIKEYEKQVDDPIELSFK